MFKRQQRERKISGDRERAVPLGFLNSFNALINAHYNQGPWRNNQSLYRFARRKYKSVCTKEPKSSILYQNNV